MAKVASAKVDVTPDTSTFGLKLREQLSKIDTGKSGNDAGRKFGERFQQGFIGSGIGATIGRFTGMTALVGSIAGPAAASINAMAASVSTLGVAAAGAAVGGVGALISGLGTYAQISATVKIGTSGVSDALKANIKVWDALNAGVEPTKQQLKNVQVTMAQLTPSAQQLVKSVGAVRKSFNDLKPSVQENLLAGFGQRLELIGKTILPGVNKSLVTTSIQLNGAANMVADYVTSSEGLTTVNRIFANNTQVIGFLTDALVPLSRVILNLVDSFSPLLKSLVATIGLWSTMADTAITAGKKTGQWEATIGGIKGIFDGFLTVLGNVFRALGHVFNAGLGPGQQMMDMLGRVTKKFEEWTATTEGQNAIKDFFQGGVTFMQALAPLIEKVWTAWQTLAKGSDPTILITAVTQLVDPLFAIFGQLSNPDTVLQMSTALASIAESFVAMNMGGALSTFVTTTATLFKNIADFVTAIPGGPAVLGGIATGLASIAAVKFTWNLTGGPLLGFAQEVIQAGGTVKTGITAIKGSLDTFKLGLMGAQAGAKDDFFTKMGVRAGNASRTVGLKVAEIGKTIATGAMSWGSTIASGLGSGLSTVGTALSTASKAVGRFAVSVATSIYTALGPVGLIILAIAAIGIALVLLYKKSETFRNAVDAVVKAVVGFFLGLWNTVRPVVMQIWAVIQTYFTMIWATIVAVVQTIVVVIATFIRIVKDIFTGNWGDIWNAIKDAFNAIWVIITEALGKIWQAIQEHLSSLWDIIKAIPGQIWDFLKGIPAVLFDLGKSLIVGLWNGIVAAWNWLVGNIVKIPGWISSALAGFWETLKSFGTNLITGLWNGIQSAWSWLVEQVKKVPGWITGALGDAWTLLKEWGANVIKGMVEGISGVGQFLKDAWNSLVSILPDMIEDKFKIHSPSLVMRDYGRDIGMGLVQGIASTAGLVTDAMDAMVSPLNTIVSPTFAPSVGYGAMAGAGGSTAPYAVNVYIGSERINDLIDMRVQVNDTDIARSLIAGRSGV